MLENKEGSCQTAALLIQKEGKRWEFRETVVASICLMKLVPLGVRAHAHAPPLGARTALTRVRRSRKELLVPSIELSHQGRFFGTDQTDLPRGEWFIVGGEG